MSTWSFLLKVSSLIFASGIMLFSHGAIRNLFILHAKQTNADETVIGTILSLTYLGGLLIGLVIRHILNRVSYIRTYCVSMAILASICIVFGYFQNAYLWFACALLYGIFVSICFVIIESWINTIVSNEVRSRIYGILFIANYCAVALSQSIISIGQDAASTIMPLIAVGFCISMLPTALTKLAEPIIDTSNTLKLTFRMVYRIAPVSAVGALSNGLCFGTLSLLVLYGTNRGISPEENASLNAAFFVGALLFQFPIGLITDKLKDRRSIIIVCTAIGAITAAIFYFDQIIPFYGELFLMFLLGGMLGVLYPLNSAYALDFVDTAYKTIYSAKLYQIYFVGGLAGPVLAGQVLQLFAPQFYFILLCFVLVLSTAFAFTDKFMPHYKPTVTDGFEVNPSPIATSSTIISQDDVASSGDIGPELQEPDENDTQPIEEQPIAVAPEGPLETITSSNEVLGPQNLNSIDPSKLEQDQESK